MKRMMPASSATYDHESLLKNLLEQIRGMRRFRSGRRDKPHKLLMLLSVIDMIESGLVADGKIYFNKDLTERFAFYFGFVAQPADSCRPHIPFFHLRSLGWWHLQSKPGREISFSEMKTCHSAKELFDNVECAVISEEVYDVLLDEHARQALRNTIAELLGVADIACLSFTLTDPKGGSTVEK